MLRITHTGRGVVALVAVETDAAQTMGRKNKARKTDDWEAAASCRASSKPGTSVQLPSPLAPILPPGHAAHDSGQWLSAEVSVLLEDGEGDAMLSARPILSADECRAWIQWGETTGFVLEKHAQTNYIAHRDNGRLAVDSTELAAAIFDRLRPWLPSEVAGKAAVGCNPNLRLYKYEAGQRFGPHIDQANRLAGGAVTEFTVLLYLNSDDGLEGGETIFHADHGRSGELLRFTPKAGAALVHAHGARCLTHEGSAVRRGVKYLLRTDVAYR